jgi:photosystem II cytochrome b559 subunit alpha
LRCLVLWHHIQSDIGQGIISNPTLVKASYPILSGHIMPALGGTNHGCIWSRHHIQSQISRGEGPFIDILQDRRYWVIHLITIPSLFLGGVIFILSGFVYKLFGVANFNQYFYKDNTQISLINDRFSILNEIEDI